MEGGNKKSINVNLRLDPMVIEGLFVNKGLTQPEIVQVFIDAQTEYIKETVKNVLKEYTKHKK